MPIILLIKDITFTKLFSVRTLSTFPAKSLWFTSYIGYAKSFLINDINRTIL